MPFKRYTIKTSKLDEFPIRDQHVAHSHAHPPYAESSDTEHRSAVQFHVRRQFQCAQSPYAPDQYALIAVVGSPSDDVRREYDSQR
jgi:hypothetical protein